MGNAIRIGIVGYGNLGRGVLNALTFQSDMKTVGIFTRRAPESITVTGPDVPVYSIDQAEQFRNEIDVMILCGGSKSDLPHQGPALAQIFNTVDSFDTHGDIPAYYDAIDAVARAARRTAMISVGWDPGLLSLNRLYAAAVLPQGSTYTFWGEGLSQGHSDAIRRVPGVRHAAQYTIPIPSAIEQVRKGLEPVLTTREKHTRHCFVVLNDGADADAVRQAIVTMPHYFSDYDTTVEFISEAEFQQDHTAMPHGGFVIHTGRTGADVNHTIEYALKLDSNPEFTASVLVAYARATWRLNTRGEFGAKTVLDVPPALLSPRSEADLRRELL